MQIQYILYIGLIINAKPKNNKNLQSKKYYKKANPKKILKCAASPQSPDAYYKNALS